ncbi:hypothetical protein HN018_02250 [Lichenicola cladoniae]|uniref:Lipoprotein n=1 Tax=Lichenicola cladoniae TaxID=1484109 RepID=A0A6M8HGN1_9PROT|nr:hypothetical protein [Lichenicola cladoniae]NPD69200.1 hypothetical protein [Acetobacteraceae bacterium]QKE89027.1 hypothetical protein HN018_02250 [Lichenicola cladoniae]
MSPYRSARPYVPLLLGTLLLGGCNPFDQPGTWHATGVNQMNLDAEAIDKTDTVAGHGTPGSDGILDAAAVLRLHTDKTKPLKMESTSGGSGASTGGNASQ